MKLHEYGELVKCYNSHNDYIVRVEFAHDRFLSEIVDAARKKYDIPCLNAARMDDIILCAERTKDSEIWKMSMYVLDIDWTRTEIFDNQSMSLVDSKNLTKLVSEKYGKEFEAAFRIEAQRKAILVHLEFMSGNCYSFKEDYNNYGDFPQISITYHNSSEEFDVYADREDMTVDIKGLDYDELESVLVKMGTDRIRPLENTEIDR